MMRWLLGLFRRSPVVVDFDGRSYRTELLQAIVPLTAKLNRRPEPKLLEKLQGLLKDLHDLEYSAAQNEAQELRDSLAAMLKRVELLEQLLNVHRIVPPGSKIPGRVA